MWPWGHLAVGYLLYSAGLRRYGRLPDSPEVFLLAFGTLFPDLVDKPLAWTFGVLESGRSLGHSVLVAAVVLAVLYVVLAPRVGRAPVVAFGVGYLSHPLADLPYGEAFAGQFDQAAYVLWPLLSVPPPEEELSFLAFFISYEAGPFDVIQLVLFGLAAYVWHLDGRPGLAGLRSTVSR